MVIFELKTEYIELYKLLKITGFCESGAEAKHVIDAGQVKVDGQKEIRRGNKIKAGQKVDYNNMTIEVRQAPDRTHKPDCC